MGCGTLTSTWIGVAAVAPLPLVVVLTVWPSDTAKDETIQLNVARQVSRWLF